MIYDSLTSELVQRKDQDIFRIFKLYDIDEMFAETNEPIIVNNVDTTVEDLSQSINEVIFKENKLEDIGFVASCECGNPDLMDNKYEGTICPICKTEVVSGFTYDFHHKVWIGVPNEVPAFIHPWVYVVLSSWLQRMKKGRHNYLDDLLIVDPKHKTPPEIAEYFDGRGFKYVYENFNYIMNYFLEIHPKTKKKVDTPFIRKFLKENRDKIFCTKLPILPKELHPITKNGSSRKYKDDASNDLSECIVDLVAVNFIKGINTTSQQQKIEKIVFKAYKAYIEYISKIVKTKLSTKYGILIEHIYGSRLHTTMRGVIRPITKIHDGDEVHVSWKMGLATYKMIVLNHLIWRKKYDPLEAIKKIEKAYIRYDFEIDQILQTIIDEAEGDIYDYKQKKYVKTKLPGLPVYIGRNPGLNPGSIQLLFITEIGPSLKTPPSDFDEVDISDNTIGISTMIVKDPNADFDGDHMNILPIFELDKIDELIKAYHPCGRMVNNDTDLTISDTAAWLNPSDLILLNGFLENN